MDNHSSQAAAPPARLYFVDWLRVLAMISIFFFHNARFFDTFDDWHVKNASTALWPSLLVGFMGQWIIPLFFVLAAAAMYHALRVRTAGEFTRERSLRLAVPLIFGMFIIVAPQAYLELVSHARLAGTSFLQFYPRYFSSLPGLNWFHLWFLAYLFVFSLVLLPVFMPAHRGGNSLVWRLAVALEKPWAFLPLFILPLAGVNIFVYPGGFWGHTGSGGWNILAYILFFVSGYLVFSNSRILETVRRLRWATLATGVVATTSLVIFFTYPLADEETYFGTTVYAVARVVQAVDSWAWILAIIGLGSQFLNGNNRFLSYSNEAVLPFYVLHQTVILMIGFYIVQWDLGVTAKYFLISTASFAAIVAVYELLVRRVNALRFLFGMRVKRKVQAG